MPNVDVPECTGTDWLLNNSNQWLITPNSEETIAVFEVYNTGYLSATIGDIKNSSNNVRPVVVLKSDVVITGGTGISGDLYQLALSE